MSIRIEGDVEVFKKQLKRLSAPDFEKVTPALAEVVRTSTLERFKTTKDSDGKQWKPSQRVREIGGTTLTDKSGLKKSLRSKSTDKGFAFGTNLRYAATHQFGDKDRVIRAKKAGGLHFKMGGEWVTVKAVRVTIPARPYLGINDEDIKAIAATIEDYLTEE